MLETPANPFQPLAEGTFVGEWSADVPFTSRFADKRWCWVGVFTETLFCAIAVVDVGYAGNTFVWVFDRASKTMLYDTSKTLPSRSIHVARNPTKPNIASASLWPGGVEILRTDALFVATANTPDFQLHLELQHSGVRPIAAAAKIPKRKNGHNVTRKQSGLPSTLFFEDKSRTASDAGYGGVDYTSGRLARQTQWLWAFGGDEHLAFNVVNGFNDGRENVIWIDGEPRETSATILQDPWRVEGDDISLTLDREADRTQNIQLGIAASKYIQPLGMWRGTICGEACEVGGVAEDHVTTW